jgi:hypothetical protein
MRIPSASVELILFDPLLDYLLIRSAVDKETWRIDEARG